MPPQKMYDNSEFNPLWRFRQKISIYQNFSFPILGSKDTTETCRIFGSDALPRLLMEVVKASLDLVGQSLEVVPQDDDVVSGLTNGRNVDVVSWKKSFFKHLKRLNFFKAHNNNNPINRDIILITFYIKFN